MIILGINYGHDSAACILRDGKILAAAAEERFTRIKNDTSFPLHAINYCLEATEVRASDIDCLANAGSLLRLNTLKFLSLPSHFMQAGSWKTRLKAAIKARTTPGIGDVRGDLPLYHPQIELAEKCQIQCIPHHLAHAASAYFTSGLGEDRALIVTMDGLGENTSTALWRGEENKITSIQQYNRNSSIGWFYGNATEALGWRHGSDEWKLMGLAPYGTPQPGSLRGFYPEFKNGKLEKPYDYGSFGVWNDHGAYHFHGNDARRLIPYVEKLGKENFAAEVQRAVEEQMFNLILPALKQQKTRNLCCAGGCFLNVKLNQRLWYSGELDTQWIYPDPADAGLAVGAALYAYTKLTPGKFEEKLKTVYWGPEYSDQEIEKTLRERGIRYSKPENLSETVAEYLEKNYAIGWFQGRMEAGPRALGNRSILMSPLVAENKDRINAKVKYREAFRPFCPSMLAEYRDTYLKCARDERFMITSFEVTDEKREKIPAVVHVDGTVRPQLVYRNTNARYYDVIKAFGDKTGEYVILNTSFNVKGEPIVCTPREAIKCFFDTGLEVLVLGSFVVEKPELFS